MYAVYLTCLGVACGVMVPRIPGGHDGTFQGDPCLELGGETRTTCRYMYIRKFCCKNIFLIDGSDEKHMHTIYVNVWYGVIPMKIYPTKIIIIMTIIFHIHGMNKCMVPSTMSRIYQEESILV